MQTWWPAWNVVEGEYVILHVAARHPDLGFMQFLLEYKNSSES